VNECITTTYTHKEAYNNMTINNNNKIRVWFSDESYTIIGSITDLHKYDHIVSMEYMN